MSKLYFSPSHEYIIVDGNVGYVGVSDFAQQQLGNVVYVDMPEQGDDLTKGEEFGAIESVKAASDLIAPVSGTVLEFNELLLDNPKLINEDAMKNWIIKVELSDPSELDDLLDEESYNKLCASENH